MGKCIECGGVDERPIHPASVYQCPGCMADCIVRIWEGEGVNEGYINLLAGYEIDIATGEACTTSK